MAKRPAKSETNMDNLNNDTSALDALTGLGLDVGEGAAGAATEAQETTEVAKHEENIDFDAIEIGVITEVPVARRVGGGGGGSKFPFDKLAAPAVNAEGKPALANFVVRYKAEFDEKKFKRSVQSATTQANRNTEGKYFESRSVMESGALKGMMVIRTDNRPAAEATEDAAS